VACPDPQRAKEMKGKHDPAGLPAALKSSGRATVQHRTHGAREQQQPNVTASASQLLSANICHERMNEASIPPTCASGVLSAFITKLERCT
jgi:hypothetical protein